LSAEVTARNACLVALRRATWSKLAATAWTFAHRSASSVALPRRTPWPWLTTIRSAAHRSTTPTRRRERRALFGKQLLELRLRRGSILVCIRAAEQCVQSLIRQLGLCERPILVRIEREEPFDE
jgi:hypothetical protein